MTAAAYRLPPPDPNSIDQRIVLQDVSWTEYQRLLDLKGERSVPRLTYLDGELELMTPSLGHEGLKKRLARLIEAYTELSGIPLEGFGSWTLGSSFSDAVRRRTSAISSVP